MSNQSDTNELQRCLYFAYGSNMAFSRLFQRVPSAQKYCQVQLYKHQLRFHKRSHVDGSAKCDAWYTGTWSDWVEGIIYNIAVRDKLHLDDIEGVGHGYAIKQVSVVDKHDRVFQAYTYVATDIDTELRPFDWYKQHVLIGAKEHHLPVEYIEQINAVEAEVDSDTERAEREMAIHVLGDKALSDGHGT
ncbi:hypothetical protein LP43_1391 [Methylophaga thiooxydans]|uniref:Gamma-glutamylcyclotransferase AIG2-like domain-containing protein n=1 Tax=Methylophaga thiooxydans TaxID=392484 RepID=A0A0A0BG32_9GAMM|nr:gamma-glutamylcyclotransferase family protein [Methylophaga thiooxydans]KGM06896.1 hypothetical protein LP43_1391 [Methylophaga thiooxydans]